MANLVEIGTISLKVDREQEVSVIFCMFIAGYVVGGEWSKEEHDKLCDAIQEYCGDWQGAVGMLPSTVTWDMISEKVGSRSAIQCRQKWSEKYYLITI